MDQVGEVAGDLLIATTPQAKEKWRTTERKKATAARRTRERKKAYFT